MFNFFAKENSQNNTFSLAGSDLNHIKNVLRMNVGDTLLISFEGASHLCEITALEAESGTAKIIEENFQNTELNVNIHLFQGLPKADKMELIIQKCVELGVHSVTPTEMSRCVVKLDGKKKQSKVERWKSIAESAAKQSKRSVIPKITDVMSFNEMLNKAKELDLFLIPYENKEGMSATAEALSKIKSGMSVGILIGPEGGFEKSEIEKAINTGGIPISLGSRILRTETAAITAVSMCMLYSEMNVG